MDHETVEEIKRHFGMVAEHLRSDNPALAEGQADIRRGVDAFRADVPQEFEETRSLIHLSCGELDCRGKGLETKGR